MTLKQRNQLLQAMTDQVAQKVLHNCYRQTLSISLSSNRKEAYHFDFSRFMEYLEANAGLDRALEFLPDDETLRERQKANLCWTRPELAVLLSYAKNDLKNRLLAGAVGTDPAMAAYASQPFPAQIRESWATQISKHRLHDEIVCNQIANDMVNRMGFSFCFRLSEAVGAEVDEIARAYRMVLDIFDLDEWWASIEALDHQVSSLVQYEMFHDLIRLSRRCTRWFLRNYRGANPSEIIEQMREPLRLLLPSLAATQVETFADKYRQELQTLAEKGVPESLAARMAVVDELFMLPGIVRTSLAAKLEPQRILDVQLELASRLNLDWLMAYLVELKPENRWQDLARESYFFDLETLLRVMASHLVREIEVDQPVGEMTNAWLNRRELLVKRFTAMVSDLRTGVSRDLSILTVCISDLKDLVDSSVKSQ